ncbi:MAG: LTA synthase family protein [Deltaproteobacteria bacterium]|nr:LTA synthase family protein [Deltaproteobacteria bacterium]
MSTTTTREANGSQNLASAPPRESLNAESPWKRPVTAALIQGTLLVLVLFYFRLAKAFSLGLASGAFDTLSLLLPELGSALVLEGSLLGLLLFAAGARKRLAWWFLFYSTHLLAYLAIVVEHTFFHFTGIRLSLQLLSYAFDNLEMLVSLIFFGVDGRLISRLVVGVLCVLLGALLAKRMQIGVALTEKKPLFLGAFAIAPAALGFLLMALPQTEQVRNSDLRTSTLSQLFFRLGDPEEAIRRAAAFQVPHEDLYQAPVVATEVPPQEDRPNILLLVLESTRADSVPPLAPEEAWKNTPNLATLATQGLVFDQSYGSVTHTSKALVTILCGMFPRFDMPIHETLEGNLPIPCLPKLLSQGGYRTAFLQTALGKFENRPGLVRNMGFQQAAFQETLSSQGFDSTGYLGMDEMAMVEPARQWITRGGPEPFFLTLLTVSPHHPYQVPGVPTEFVDASQEHYWAALHHQDLFIGRILEVLQQAEVLDNTVVIALGDHGEAFGEHWRRQHDIVPYEESAHVPLILWAPSLLGPPQRKGGLRHHLDIVPTVLELTDTTWRGQLPGKSLLSSPGHDRVLISCWFTDTCLAVRQGNRKLIYHYGLRPTEVFDLESDPREAINLAPTLPEEELHRWEAESLALKLSFDSFYQDLPLHSGPERWWQQAP